MQHFLFRLAVAIWAVGGGIVCVWLSFTSLSAAYVAMATYGVGAVGAIALVARSERRYLFTAPQTTTQDDTATANASARNR